MSRYDLLDWVNKTAHVTHNKVEELCSGVAYCVLMEQLYPNCIALKKIKKNAKLEYEYFHNLRLFQAAFLRLNLNKAVPIDLIIKGRFQDNLEFLQWFKKFYDNQGREIYGNNVASKPPSPTTNVVPINIKNKQIKPIGAGVPQLQIPEDDDQSVEEERSVSPSAKSVLLENVAELTEQCTYVNFERRGYFKRLTAIETLLKESIEKKEFVEWSTRALNILWDHKDLDNTAKPSLERR